MTQPAAGNLDVLPVWKKGATAYERLMEMALYARAYPHKFEKFALVYQEALPNGNVKFSTMSHDSKCNGEGLTLLEVLGLFEAGKIRAWDRSEK